MLASVEMHKNGEAAANLPTALPRWVPVCDPLVVPAGASCAQTNYRGMAPVSHNCAKS